MHDLLNQFLERPSRLLGWGVVAAVHLLAWQVLVHGLNWVNVMPVMNAVQVSLVNDEPPPSAMPPALPNVQSPLTTEMFVPTPEVKVTQESTMMVVATPVPPATVTNVVTTNAPPAAYSPTPVVVTESDVDYLVRPEIRYPHASRRDNEHGMVLLSVIVNTRGLVENVNIYKSSGFARLDECATRAMRSMRVKPYIRNGIAMAIELRIPVEFS